MANRITLHSGAQPLPGCRLAKVIGKGGFAEVWEAARDDGERIALKFISSANTGTTVKEIKSLSALQNLDHPGLIRMDSISSIPGYIVISMELAEGSLFDLLQAFQTEFQSAVDLKLLLDYLDQAARAIDYLNQRQHVYESRTVGFQHCDIKPSNILLFGDKVKLADFGLSTATYAAANPILRMGTIDFAAPEIHRGILSEHSDQYSLAITYYYLRTGRFPFPPPPGGKFETSQSYNRPAPDLSQVPPQEQKILLRALELNTAKRWPSCYELIRKIRDVHGFTTTANISRSGLGMASGGGMASGSGIISRSSAVATATRS